MIPIIDIDAKPHAMLKRGEHLIEGEISWPTIPNRLMLPVDAAMISLKINGQQIPDPHFHPDTGLELVETSNEHNAIDMTVVR